MAGTCPSISPDEPFLSGMLDYIDCQALTIGENGYRALASPTSSMSPLLTLAITIFVALLGYRFLMGNPPRAREAIMTAVKVGVVLMLATSWPSFRTLAYDVTMRGPAQLAQVIGEPAGLPGASGGLNNRLQGVDQSIAELMVRGTGQQSEAGSAFGQSAPSAQWIPFNPTRNGTMLAHARSIYLASTIGAFASVRLLAGFLLALGPIFALFLLFNGTRGLFEGWLRGLVGAALGATVISIILAVEIALMEPWLSGVLSARRAEISTPSVPVELFVATLVFAFVLVAALFAVFRIVSSFRLPEIQRHMEWIEKGFHTSGERKAAPQNREIELYEPTRAKKVAEAITASQRRENAGYHSAATGPGRAVLVADRLENSGRSSRARSSRRQVRRPQLRTSSHAQRRDSS
ncbi:MAG: type IV secretion system protein [Sphingorhabdus sp.]